jgi:vitamin B12 transporter
MRRSKSLRRMLMLSAGALHFLAPAALHAQAAVPGDEGEAAEQEIVVTASLSGEGVNRNLVGSSITLIDAQDLSDRETRIVSDVLRDVPGVAVSRTGAVGGATQIRIRGSEGNHVLVFVDGIKVSDPYQGEFDFATLIADDTARIEVLRGQQSSIYGSDAIGGVINYITQSGKDAPGIRVRAEAGSLNSYNASARVARVSGNFDYVVSGAFTTTDGYPTAPGGARDVGAQNVALSTKLGWTPSEVFKVTGVLRYNHTEADTNDQGVNATAPVVRGRQVITVVDTPESYYRNKAVYGLLRADLETFGGLMATSAMAQITSSKRDAYAAFGYNYGNQGTRYRGALIHAVNFGTARVNHRLTVSIDAEREDYRNAAPSAPDKSRKTLDTVGFVAQYNLAIDERFAVGGSLRYDDNSYFDDATTWHVETSYLLNTGTRFHAAAGSGVKAPVSFELFGYSSGQYIGNPDLRPEESVGWEAGVDQAFAQGAITIGATYFDNRLTNEIYTAYIAPSYTGTSLNRTTKTRQKGIELFSEARLGDFRASGSWTWLDAPQSRNVLLNPEDPASFATGAVETQAVRRPKYTGSFNLTYAPADLPVSGTLTVRYNGKMKDVVYTPSYMALYADMPAFTLVNLSLRYKVTSQVEVFARAENLFDEKYQEVFTYNTPGRTVYGGLRARF